MRRWRSLAGIGGAVALVLGVLPMAGAQAAGEAVAGMDIGNAAQLTGSTSGSLASSTSDDWWVVYPASAGGAVAVTVKVTTASSSSCDGLVATLYATNGTSQAVSDANLSRGDSQEISGSRVASDRYFVEVKVRSCEPPAPVTYTLTLNSGGGGTAPSPASGSIAAGTSIGDAWPPLQGKTSYTGTVASGTEEDWYVLYKQPGTSPASVRVENTTVAGSTSCTGLSVNLDAADGGGDVVSGATLNDNSAVTMTVTGTGSPDYLGRYYLEIQDGNCPSGGTTYRIEPEPSTGWANPAKPASEPLPSGADRKAAGGPLSGGVTYDAALANGTTQDWVFLVATGSTPLTVSVQNTTSNQDNCQGESVTLLDSDGTVSGADLGDDDEAELVADTAQTFYLEITVADDCPPDSPLTATVTLTPPSAACSCGCAATADHDLRPAAGTAFEIEMHKPGGGTIPVAGKTTTVGVGEPLDLSLACAPGGTAPTGPYRWKLPAKSGYPVTLSSYDITDNTSASSSTLVKLTKFTDPTFSFYVLKSGTYTVTVTASVNGTQEEVPASFNVKAPVSELTAATCPAALNTLWTYELPVGEFRPPRLTLGFNNQCVKTSGLAWSAKATLKDKVLPDSDLAVVQLVNGTVKHSTQKKACLSTSGWEADGSAFYRTSRDNPMIKGHTVSGFSSGPDMVEIKVGRSNTLASSDSPSVLLRNGATWTANLDYTDYLMYRPHYKATGFGHFGIWVALRELSWTFKSAASFNAKTHRWKLGGVTTNPKKIGSVASSAEPQFSRRIQGPASCP